MKRDLDLVRDILLFLEEMDTICEHTHDIAIPERTHEEIVYHIRLMTQARLVTSQNASCMEAEDYVIIRLTNAGHDYLDKIRSESIWSKVKKKAGSFLSNLPFSAISAICDAVIKEELGL